MEFKDYYDILGVEPDADRKAIKTAYRRLARKYHPDVSDVDDAGERFKDISEAYEVLADDEKRAEYDQLRRYRKDGRFEPPPGWQGASGEGFSGGFTDDAAGMDFSEFFSSIFGAGAARGFSRGPHGGEDISSARGRDMEVEMPLFLENILEEQQKTVEYKLPIKDSQGRVTEKTKTLKVKIPAGVREDERIRLKGQGAPGISQGPPGDLYLRIRLAPHPLFDVMGKDLSLTVPIAPWEAALGAQVTVPTLTGRIRLTVSPGSQSGQRLRIKGKGLKRRGEQAGDLYAILNVVMPDRTDEETRPLWEQLAEKAAFNPRKEWGTQS